MRALGGASYLCRSRLKWGQLPPPFLIAVTTITALTAALSGVIRKGLPIDESDAPDELVNLRSVYARAVVPGERMSRLSALNALIPRVIASLSDDRYREAIQNLFGLAPGTRRLTLMARRRKAAGLLAYTEGHFREAIEAELLHAVAVALQEDLLRYRARTRRSAESLEPTGDTPRLGPEHLTHEEELTSRIWQHVYGLRAELIACLRLIAAEGFKEQAEDHRQAALAEETQLRASIREWKETYGDQLVRHGDAEFAADAIRRLVAWEL